MELAGALSQRDNQPLGQYCPIERVLGTTLLGSSVVNSIRNGGRNNGNFGGGFVP